MALKKAVGTPNNRGGKEKLEDLKFHFQNSLQRFNTQNNCETVYRTHTQANKMESKVWKWIHSFILNQILKRLPCLFCEERTTSLANGARTT